MHEHVVKHIQYRTTCTKMHKHGQVSFLVPCTRLSPDHITNSNVVIATSFPSSQVKVKRTKMSSLACTTRAMDWVGSSSETRPEAVVLRGKAPMRELDSESQWNVLTREERPRHETETGRARESCRGEPE